MKMIVAALVLGAIGNTGQWFGTSWPIGSVIAIVIMGVYVKKCVDKHFQDLNARLDTYIPRREAEENSEQNSSD